MDHSSNAQITFGSIRSKNEEAYSRLFELEVILRELLAKKLREAHGQKWMKRGLPPDVLDDVKNGLAYERRFPWSKGVLHHPLYYIDFSDLKKIIISGNNWPTIFSNVFGQKASTDGSLSDLEMVRNKIAHNRFITSVDMSILDAAHKKLIGCLSADELDAARTSAVDQPAIARLLDEIAVAIDFSSRRLINGDPISESDIAAFGSLEEWWFDELYLGHPTEPIETFAALCNIYTSLPRGLGQALARIDWVATHDAENKANDALRAVKQILLAGGMHADQNSGAT